MTREKQHTRTASPSQDKIMIAALEKKDVSSNKKANTKEPRTKSEFCLHEAGLAMGKRLAVLDSVTRQWLLQQKLTSLLLPLSKPVPE